MIDSNLVVTMRATKALTDAQNRATYEAERTAWRMELVDAEIARGEITTFEELRARQTWALQGYHEARLALNAASSYLTEILQARGLQ